MKTNLYYIQVTDTYAGEANYSWVTHHIIKAKSMRGAVQRFGRMSGMSWHCVGDYGGDYGDSKRYDSRSGTTCYFITGICDAYELGNLLQMNLETNEAEEC